MALLAKTLMDEFDASRRVALDKDDYDLAQTYSTAESVVNNVMHGKPIAEIINRVIDNFNRFATQPDDEGYGIHAQEVLALTYLFVQIHDIEGVPIPDSYKEGM